MDHMIRLTGLSRWRLRRWIVNNSLRRPSQTSWRPGANCPWINERRAARPRALPSNCA